MEQLVKESKETDIKIREPVGDGQWKVTDRVEVYG